MHPSKQSLTRESGALAGRFPRHDATGFLRSFFGVGPGYGGAKPDSPLSGQIEGILRELINTSKLPSFESIGLKTSH